MNESHAADVKVQKSFEQTLLVVGNYKKGVVGKERAKAPVLLTDEKRRCC